MLIIVVFQAINALIVIQEFIRVHFYIPIVLQLSERYGWPDGSYALKNYQKNEQDYVESSTVPRTAHLMSDASLKQKNLPGISGDFC